jgi:hypothetical protein
MKNEKLFALSKMTKRVVLIFGGLTTVIYIFIGAIQQKTNVICNPNDIIDVLILITSAPDHFAERQALRSTWLSFTQNNKSNVRYAFLLGISTDTATDIIKGDFIDTYANLTLKVLMGFKWAITNCAHARYVMKTDDDMYVNIPNLLIATSSIPQNAIIGTCMEMSKPFRSRSSKWYASKEDYPAKYYPKFCSGTGYVTKMNVVKKIYEISREIPFFHLEDIYIALCIQKLNYTAITYRGFHNLLQVVDPCVYRGGSLITSHGLTPSKLLEIWQMDCKK